MRQGGVPAAHQTKLCIILANVLALDSVPSPIVGATYWVSVMHDVPTVISRAQQQNSLLSVTRNTTPTLAMLCFMSHPRDHMSGPTCYARRAQATRVSAWRLGRICRTSLSRGPARLLAQ